MKANQVMRFGGLCGLLIVNILGAIGATIWYAWAGLAPRGAASQGAPPPARAPGA
jgi:hypothetical protein